MKYDRALRAENEWLKKEIEGLKIENEAFLERTEVDERSAELRMQKYLGSEATLRFEQSRTNERLSTPSG